MLCRWLVAFARPPIRFEVFLPSEMMNVIKIDASDTQDLVGTAPGSIDDHFKRLVALEQIGDYAREIDLRCGEARSATIWLANAVAVSSASCFATLRRPESS